MKKFIISFLILIIAGGLFYFLREKYSPKIHRITPNQGEAGERLTLKIDGEHFQKGVSVEILDFIKVEKIKYIDDTKIEVDIYIQPDVKIDVNSHIKIVNPLGLSSKWWDTFIVLRSHIKKPDIEQRATARLVEEEKRDRHRLELGKDETDLDCLKDSIIKVLQEDGFEFRRPIFDDENRLQTHIKEVKGQIFSEKEHFERVVVSVRISEKNNKYRVFMVADGTHRRRKGDIDQEENIPKHRLDQFIDNVVSQVEVNINNCLNKCKIILIHSKTNKKNTITVTDGIKSCSVRAIFIDNGFTRYGCCNKNQTIIFESNSGWGYFCIASLNRDESDMKISVNGKLHILLNRRRAYCDREFHCCNDFFCRDCCSGYCSNFCTDCCCYQFRILFNNDGSIKFIR
ncbi:MAG: hypothetical protein GY795_16560 [Desulfobacterales bacterium]|nr:hypothetical protein [Desulfobacterales bacterium]